MKGMLVVALALAFSAPGCAARTARSGRKQLQPFVFLDCQLIKKSDGKASCSCPRPVAVGIDAKSRATIYECKSNGGTK